MKNKEKVERSAYSYGLALLSRRGYSERDLTDRLRRQGYLPEEIDKALGKLSHYGFLNDEELAQGYFRKYTASGKYGFSLIRIKLQQKGFSSEVIQKCLSQYDAEQGCAQAIELIRQHYKGEIQPERAKMCRYLAARGFTSDIIRKAVEEAF